MPLRTLALILGSLVGAAGVQLFVAWSLMWLGDLLFPRQQTILDTVGFLLRLRPPLPGVFVLPLTTLLVFLILRSWLRRRRLFGYAPAKE